MMSWCPKKFLHQKILTYCNVNGEPVNLCLFFNVFPHYPATCFSTSYIFRLQVRGKCLNIFFLFAFPGHIKRKLARKVWFIRWPFYFTCSGINPVKLIESDSARQMGWFLFTLSRYLDNYFTKTISFWQNKTVIKCYFAQSISVASSAGYWSLLFLSSFFKWKWYWPTFFPPPK